MTEPSTTTGAAPALPDPADLLEGVYVVLVAHPEPGQLRTRRRVFYSLTAAQRAADRAAMRGTPAAVVLARLAPVHTFASGWSV